MESVKFGGFTIEAAFVDDEGVLMCGKVFEIGDYPDKGFSVTEEEMDDSISSFTPVEANLEHSEVASVLGNALGGLRRLWRSGKHVLGEVFVPKWLADLTGGRMKVSLEFNRDKQVVGIGYTLNPRITDAQVAAAFSSSGSRGVLPTAGTGTGAVTQVFESGGGSEGPAALQQIHDLAVAGGAMCGEREACMHRSLKDKVVSWFKGAAGSEGVAVGLPEATPSGSTTAGGLEAQIAELELTNAAIAAQFAIQESERFADEAIGARKAFPAERDKIIAAYTAALEADGGGAFSFTLGKLTEGKNVRVVRELIEARPAHQLTTEAIPGMILHSDSGYFSGKGMERGRKKQLLAHSETGTEALRSGEAK